MVCCVTRVVVLRHIKFHRTMWERMHVKYLANLNISKHFHESHERNSYQCNTKDITTVKLFSYNNVPMRCKGLICQVHDSCGSETDSDSEEVDGLLDPSVSSEEKESIHDVLSPNSEDPVILRLKSIATVHDVLDAIFENEANMKGIYLTHAILALWDLQMTTLILSEKPYINESSHLVPESFISHMTSLPNLKKFLVLVKDYCEDMSPNALSCTVLYLGKLGFGDVIDSDLDCRNVVYEVTLKLLEICESQLHEFPLPALSRFMVATRVWSSSCPSIYKWTTIHGKVKHVIEQLIEYCTCPEDFRLLTICLANLRPSPTEVLDKFKTLVEDLLSKGTLGPPQLRPVVKAAAFLNLPHWSHLNIDLIRSLLLTLKGRVNDLRPSDLVLVNRVLQSQMEPADIFKEVQETASNLLQDKNHSVPVIDLLACLVHYVQPAQKSHFEEVTLEFIHSSLSPRLLPVTFKVLRHLKTSNVELCDAFWSRALAYIQAKPRLQEGHRLLRFCHWYMHFNNNLGGTYRHHKFETCITEILLRELPQWKNPSSIACACAFAVAYGRTSHRPEVVIELTKRLFNLIPKLNANDCLIVSHGLRISMGVGRASRSKNKNVFLSWTQLARKLDRWSEEQLVNDNLILRDLNVIARGFIERRFFNEKSFVLSEHLAKRYDAIVSGLGSFKTSDSSDGNKMLSSRVVRDVSANMLGGGWLLPNAANTLADYAVQQGLHLSGETMERVLQNFFHLNHWPQAGNKFFESASEVFIRDKDRIPGLSLLQASLGLCYFQSLPTSLIHYIFAVDFLEKLDDEIRHCYAKATYPVRVRYNLMELNRAVCLDYPQADVPWFHKKYCEELIAMDPGIRLPLHVDVMASLLELVDGNNEFIQEKAYSPYFHKIDFLMVLDEHQNPLNPKQVTQKDILEKKLTRVAVLLRRGDSYCNCLGETKPHLRGLPQLHQRHLELLGYQVVVIPFHYWDSMQMASPEARYKYLKERIFGGA